MDNYRSFNSEVKTSGKLHQMLNQPQLTPQKLFGINNISGDINQNIQAFLNFCRKRKQFTTRMLKICLNSTYQQLQDQNTKRVAQYSIEVLTNDEDALTDFLFSKPVELKAEQISLQQKSTQQQVQSASAIESEAERLFNDTPTKNIEPTWSKQSQVFQKYQLVCLTLQHLKQKQKNQTCLGYINKLYSSLLRRQGNLFLQFLVSKPECIDLLIANIKFFSIGNILALALACEDKTGQYKYEELKKTIFKKILQYGFDNTCINQNFEGFVATCEQILNSTKQSYYEYFQDFKRCANTLVSEQTLRQFYQQFKIDNETIFGSISSYFQLIMKRIKSQTQQQDYYRQNQNSEPSMKFQHHFLFAQVQQLLNFIGRSQKYSSMSRVIYLGFFNSLLKSMATKEISIGNLQTFKQLISFYEAEKANGIVKNYLFQILKTITKRFKQEQYKQIAGWLVNSTFELQNLRQIFQISSPTSLFPVPKQNHDSNIKSNSNSSSCFVLSLFFDIQNKQNTFLDSYMCKNEINLKYSYQKYKTKLANYGQQEQLVSPICEQVQLNFKIATKNRFTAFLNNDNNQQKTQKQQQLKQFETQTVGKNSVIIPVLNLPSKLQSMARFTVQEQINVQPLKAPIESSKQALIRELKNTKFHGLQKFINSKSNQTPSVNKPVENGYVLSKNVENLNDKKVENIKHDNKSPPAQIKEMKQLPDLRLQKELKYFVRHILLF